MMIMARHLPIFYSYFFFFFAVASLSPPLCLQNISLALSLSLSVHHKREVKLPELGVERSHSLVDEEALCAEATLRRMLPTVL
jgi:hypothetical protein